MTTKKIEPEILIDDSDFDLFGDIADLALPEDPDAWAEKYPVIQWHNREGAWEFPGKDWAGTEIERDYQMIEVPHGNTGRETEFGALLPIIHVAVLAHRQAWEKPVKDPGGRTRRLLANSRPEGEKGWAIRYQAIGYIREARQVCIISIKSWTGARFTSAYKNGRAKLVRLTAGITGQEPKGYMFYVPMAASGTEMVGSDDQSEINPPGVAFDQDTQLSDRAMLVDLRLERDKLLEISNYMYEEAQRWAAEWDFIPADETGGTGIMPIRQDPETGALIIPNLTDQKPDKWFDQAMTFPGLFTDRNAAGTAYAQVIRKHRGKAGTTEGKWQVWTDHLQQLNETLMQLALRS